MAYCTITEVQAVATGSDKLIQLTDYEDVGIVDATVLAAAIAEADALIDSYVQLRHAVPLASVPDAVKFSSARLTVYYLKARRGVLTEQDALAYENDIAWLKAVRSGEATLGVDPLPAKSSLVVDAQSARPSDKQVSRDNTRGYW